MSALISYIVLLVIGLILVVRPVFVWLIASRVPPKAALYLTAELMVGIMCLLASAFIQNW